MLLRFRASGFKTLRRAELEFGRVNLFIGGNGAGKSNILEAIGILSAGLKDISDIELQKRGVRLSVPTLFKSAFKHTDLRANLNLQGSFENSVTYNLSIKAGQAAGGLRFFSESISHNNRKIMGRSQAGITVRGLNTLKKDIDPTRGLWDRFREVADMHPLVEKELERLARYTIYAPQTGFLRGTDVEQLLVQPMGLQGSGLAQAAQAVLQFYQASNTDRNTQDLVNRVFSLISAPGWTKAFRIRNFNEQNTSRLVRTGEASLYFVDTFMKEGRNVLSAYDSSEGTLYLLFIAVLLLHENTPKIFALDNVDNALNPSITRQLLERLIMGTCSDEYRAAKIGPDQVFLTSHNPTSLDAFDLFHPDQRIFVVARDQSGATQVKRLRPPEGISRADWIDRQNGRSLSEMWIDGKIKGALGEAL